MSQIEQDIQDSEVIEVQKSYFFDGFKLPVNIFLKMTAGRFILIGKKDDRSTFSSLTSFQHPESQVFVLKTDYSTFIHAVTSLTEALMAKKEVPLATKTKFVKGLIDHVLSVFEKKNFSNEYQLRRVSKTVLGLCQNISNFDEITNILKELPNDDSKHAISTCIIATMLCEEMEFKQPLVMEKMVKASLLHDIGLRYIPQEILRKPRHQWTSKERAIYETHPMKGVEALRDMKGITNDVLMMISEHHENALGTGFPKKLRDVKISPLGRVLIVANFFSDLLYERVETTKVYEASQAVDYMEDILGQPFNKQVFRALKTVILKDEAKNKMKTS